MLRVVPGYRIGFIGPFRQRPKSYADRRDKTHHKILGQKLTSGRLVNRSHIAMQRSECQAHKQPLKNLQDRCRELRPCTHPQTVISSNLSIVGNHGRDVGIEDIL